VPPEPSTSAGEVFLKTHEAMAQLMRDRGFDRYYGRLLFGRFRALGLTEVGAEARMFMMQSGSAGAALLRANYEQLRGALVDSGYVTEREFQDDLSRLGDSSFMMPSSMMWAAWGRPVSTCLLSEQLYGAPNRAQFTHILRWSEDIRHPP